MDVFMDLYFEETFQLLERDCLSERYKRRELVSYFTNVIAGCSKGQEISENTTCRYFVRAALRYHNTCKAKNGNVCLMGKFHNILYVAMKIAFDLSLQDNATVASLLDEIFDCEKTFERIFLGAIFGTSAPHFIAGWKSDFLDKEENIHALVFFLDHATNANLEYGTQPKLVRFIDVPMESCGMAPPVRVVIQMGAAEMLMILLRFGARIQEEQSSSNAVESILDRLNQYKRKYPYELVSCLKLILRAVPTIKLTIDKSWLSNLNLAEDYNYHRKIFLEKYGDLIEDRLIPPSRCGIVPPDLKHLCRCTIRKELWRNFQLPFGIKQLNLPSDLAKYIDILDD